MTSETLIVIYVEGVSIGSREIKVTHLRVWLIEVGTPVNEADLHNLRVDIDVFNDLKA